MTLENLLEVLLERVAVDKSSVLRLLDAANRSLNDAKLAKMSSEGRFDMAYKSIMQVANAALQANGYRALTSRPGHHQTMIQSLPKTIGLAPTRMILLDKMRKQRNVCDYSGDLVGERFSWEAVDVAEELLRDMHQWLQHSLP